MSTSQTLERDILKFASTAESERGRAQALELLTGLTEYYDEIQDAIHDGKVEFDTSITVKVDGKTIKFKSIDEVSEWLTK